MASLHEGSPHSLLSSAPPCFDWPDVSYLFRWRWDHHSCPLELPLCWECLGSRPRKVPEDAIVCAWLFLLDRPDFQWLALWTSGALGCDELGYLVCSEQSYPWPLSPSASRYTGYGCPASQWLPTSHYHAAIESTWYNVAAANQRIPLGSDLVVFVFMSVTSLSCPSDNCFVPLSAFNYCMGDGVDPRCNSSFFFSFINKVFSIDYSKNKK